MAELTYRQAVAYGIGQEMERDPSVVTAAAPETVGGAVRGDAEGFARPLRQCRGMLECAREALHLALRPASIVAAEIGDHDSRSDGDDDHDDEHFDEREAAHCAAALHRSHDPMSESFFAPPGWPSAPKLKTSISPCRPGFRY